MQREIKNKLRRAFTPSKRELLDETQVLAGDKGSFAAFRMTEPFGPHHKLNPS